MIMKWITSDSLGEIAFGTKKAIMAVYPDRKAIRCSLAMTEGWLAMNREGTENDANIKTPDGREIPVVWGWTPYGVIIGMRGGSCTNTMAMHWQAIMSRAVDVSLKVMAYKLQGKI